MDGAVTMPLPVPNLDDRRWSDLVSEARAMIPVHAPEWTNHNPADPGITLVELFAWVSELLLYRLNQVSDEDLEVFLRLFHGPKWRRRPGVTLDLDMEAALQELGRPERAVSREDFETLAREAHAGVARAVCIPRRDLSAATGVAREAERAASVSLMVFPRGFPEPPSPGDATHAAILEAVRTRAEARRLVGTRVHVVLPRLVPIGIRVTLGLHPGSGPDEVSEQARARLAAFLNPVTGGPGKAGWPSGRSVYVAEIYQILAGTPGVNFVTRTLDTHSGKPLEELVAPAQLSSRFERDAAGELIAVRVRLGEVPAPDFNLMQISFTRGAGYAPAEWRTS
jgi:hypothetical protein